MALGEKRANAVRDFLVTQGVNGSSLEVVSFGEEQPAATGSDEASWSQNRRVEVKY
jgi:peptidoglycan-associated lipoprotein